MSKSFSYNVVVTKSSKVADKLFFNTSKKDGLVTKTRLTSIMTGLTREEIKDSLIISPFSNNGFISLIDDFPGGGSSKFITLKMVESKELLESFFVPSNAQDEVVTQRFKQRLANVKAVDYEALELLKSIRPRYYLAYGIGDDVSQWAGPFVIELVDARLTVTSDGVRELELGFMPQKDTVKLFTNKQYNDLGYGQGQSNFDSLDLTDKVNKNLTKNLPLEKSRIQPPVDPGILQTGPRLEKFLPKLLFGFDDAIRRLLRDYIADKAKTIPKGNVMVLLDQNLDNSPEDENCFFKRNPPKENGKDTFPDFIKLYQDVLRGYGISCRYTEQYRIQQEIKEERKTEERKDGILDSINIMLKSTLARFDKTTNKEIERLRTEVFMVEPRAGDQRTDEYLAAIRELEFFKARKKKEREKIIDDINQEFAEGTLKVVQTSDEYARVYSPKKIKIPGTTTFERRTPSNPDHHSETKRREPDTYGNVDLTFLITEGESKVGSYLESLRPIHLLFDKLKENTDKSFAPIIFEENNLKITTLLAKHNLIEDGSKPVILVGDRKLIKDLIYSKSTTFSYDARYVFPESGSVDGLLPFDDDSSDRREVIDRIMAYKKDVSNLLYPKRGMTSSLNEKIDFGPYKSFESRVQDESLVFMHNLKNSNVISLNFDSSPYKASLMQISYEPMYKLLDQAVDNNEVMDDTISFKAIEYLKNHLPDPKVKEVGYTTKDLPQIFKSINEDGTAIRMLYEDGLLASGTGATKAASFTDFLLLKLNGTTLADIAQLAPYRKVAQYEADTLRKINSYMLSVDIKTLPFFNTHSFLGRHCLLVGAPNKVLGSTVGTDNGRTKVPPPAIFSKGYNIFRYKNVITSTEAYSEFTLYLDGFGNDVGASNNAKLIDLINLENIEKITKDKAKGYSSFGELLSEVEIPRGFKG